MNILYLVKLEDIEEVKKLCDKVIHKFEDRIDAIIEDYNNYPEHYSKTFVKNTHEVEIPLMVVEEIKWFCGVYCTRNIPYLYLTQEQYNALTYFGDTIDKMTMAGGLKK